MSTGQCVAILYGWGVKAGWLFPYVDKRVILLYLTRASLSALEMSIAHFIKHYTNVFSLAILTRLFWIMGC